MKEHSVERAYLYLAAGLVIGIVAGTILHQSAVVSLLFAATFLLLFPAAAVQAYNAKELPLTLFLVLCCAGLCLFNILQGAKELQVSYLKKWAVFISTLLFFHVVVHIEAGERAVFPLLFLGAAPSLLYCAAFFFLEHEVFSGGLTLGFSNPNLTGVYLMHAMLYLALLAYYTRYKLLRLLCGGLFLVSLVILEETRCRSAMVGLAVFFLLAVVCLWLKPKRFSAPVSAFFLLLPLLFALLYLLANQIGLLSVLSPEGGDLTSKSFTSRVIVWTEAMEFIGNHPLFGAYREISETALGQRHNIHLDVLASYGIPVFLLFAALLHVCVLPIGEKADTPARQLALCAFFGIMAAGIFEAGLFSGTMGLYVFSGGFLLLARFGYCRHMSPVCAEEVDA